MNEQDNVGPLIKAVAAALAKKVDYELILVDDGSTDKTVAKIEQYMDKIPSYVEISEISNLIKDFFVKFRKNCDLSIVYGGSVDSLNFRKISEIKNINGALIGGSSLRYSELKKIVSSSN